MGRFHSPPDYLVLSEGFFVENKMGPSSKNYQLYPFPLMYTHGTLPQSTQYNLSAFCLTYCTSMETNLFANNTAITEQT